MPQKVSNTNINAEMFDGYNNEMIRKTYKYGNHPLQSLDVIPSSKNLESPTIIFWHGGSWQGGDKKTYRFIGRAFSKLGCNVVIPNYRLYPEVQFPAFIEDGALAIKWAATQFPKSKIILMGHSAGAHIAAMLTFENKYLNKIGVNSGRIGGLIGISGPYNFDLSPNIKKVFSGFPKIEWNPYDRVIRPKPAMLIYGEKDKVVLTSNSEDLYQKLRKLGGKPMIIEFPILGHISILLPLIVRFTGYRGLRLKLIQFLEQANQ